MRRDEIMIITVAALCTAGIGAILHFSPVPWWWLVPLQVVYGAVLTALVFLAWMLLSPKRRKP